MKDPADPLASTQAALPISLIATPRSALFTCAANERVPDVVARLPDFDHIPVTEDGQPESRVLGMLEAHRFRKDAYKGEVSEVYASLCEEHLIGSDAPIIDFILEASNHDCRLLVSGKSISGLVTVSDLQALPVRAALFTLITRLELVMADWIKSVGETAADAWLGRLDNYRRSRVLTHIRAARQADTYVDDLSCTYFDDKATIVRTSEKFAWDDEEFAEAMDKARKLRNALAHAHEYAATRKAAQQVCATVSAVSSWIDLLTPSPSLFSLATSTTIA
jgi:hypothetical protein